MQYLASVRSSFFPPHGQPANVYAGEKDGIAMQDYSEQERLVGRGSHEQELEDDETIVPRKSSHEEAGNGTWKPPYLAHRESGSRGSYSSLRDEEV